MNLNEMHYIPRAFFLEQILGCGQQTIAEEGIERFKFYLEREADRTEYDYYLIPYHTVKETVTKVIFVQLKANEKMLIIPIIRLRFYGSFLNAIKPILYNYKKRFRNI